MSGLGLLGFIATALELCVPSYALRLVRRFGAHQVGSFVVIAFASLALLHLLNPLKPAFESGLALSLVYGIASVLLLIGMGHTETICQQRQQTLLEEQNLRLKLDGEAKDRADNLLQLKQQMAQEIVRLQQQVETLSVSERQYRLLFTQHPHAMWMFDLRSGRILAANQAALNQYGFSQQEFTKLSAKDLLAREASQAFQVDAAKPCSTLEDRGVWLHRRKDRTTFQVEVLALDLRFGDSPARLVFIEDIAPRLNREARLADYQRMRILRRVAEGVAHHFGQLLSAVESQPPKLQDGRPGVAQNDDTPQVLAETRRGNALIRQLLTAAACEGFQAEPVDLNLFVRNKEDLLQRLVGDAIALEFHFAEGLVPAMVDTKVLEHILLNLILNSRYALPHGGSIEIHTQAAWVDGHRNHLACDAMPGQYVQLTIQDNGCGMAPETQEHIFEPFFTTREDKNAMGLGLATIYGAVKQHGGWVEFASQPHRGTEFSVFLPIAQPIAQLTGEQPGIAPASRETVLLVEANDRVRDLARHILQRHGYRVIEADCASTALVLMEAQAKDVALALMDLSFPDGSTGRDLAAQLHQLNPAIKVVYAGQLNADDHDPALLEDAKLLLKPYTPDQLLQTLSGALGVPANQAS